MKLPMIDFWTQFRISKPQLPYNYLYYAYIYSNVKCCRAKYIVLNNTWQLCKRYIPAEKYIYP